MYMEFIHLLLGGIFIIGLIAILMIAFFKKMELREVVWLIIGLLVMILIGYMIYLKFVKKDPKVFVPNQEYIPKIKKYECKLFYTKWCPHCKDTLIEWGKYKATRPDIQFTLVDCEKEKEEATLYDIDSYPTIIMLINDKKYIFDSNFSKETMDKFVDMVLSL